MYDARLREFYFLKFPHFWKLRSELEIVKDEVVWIKKEISEMKRSQDMGMAFVCT